MFKGQSSSGFPVYRMKTILVSQNYIVSSQIIEGELQELKDLVAQLRAEKERLQR